MEKTLLNLIPGACSPEVHLSQYDKGRAIPFKLAEGKSAYSVPDGSEIVVEATKPSGLGFVVPVTFDGDTATMTVTETMSNEYGRFPAELSITKNGNKIGTANFVMNIERSPHPEGTTDGDAETIIPELTLLVERIEAAADSVDEDTQIVTEAKAEVLQAKADTLQAKADTLSAKADALQAKADAITAKESAEASAQAAEEASERAEELIGSVSTKADAIVKTALGEIASFTDGGDDLPMKSLKVNIVPKQSGSGDPSPSNVRPISGWDEVEVVRCGKNLLDPAYREDTAAGGGANIRFYYNQQQGSIEQKLIFKSGVTYTLSFSGTNASGLYIKKTATTSAFTKYNSNFITFTPTEDFYGAVDIYWITAPTGGTASLNPVLTVGSSVETYEPYEAETKSITLPSTVYGGTLDVVSGVLTIDKALVDLGSLSWSRYSSASTYTYRARISDMNATTTERNSGLISSAYTLFYGLQLTALDNNTMLRFGGEVFIRDDRYTDATAFKTAMNGVQLVYELATPTEITLTPTQVTTLLGNNNIWSDSGTVEVEYRADTTLAYNELLAMILENIGN